MGDKQFGHTVSHKWFMISRQDSNGNQTGTVEVIDFADANPRWEFVGNILQPLATTKAVRPVITNAPENISYGGHFDITVAGKPDQISSIVMLRSDHNTHSLTTGDRYVKLSFQQKGTARKGEMRIRSPKLPAQAVPGIYMLFVIDRAGVPSLSTRVYLQ